MLFYADLHLHSKYSRATSRDCDLEHLAFWARKKGLHVIGTGDFTHPAWFEEIKTKLKPAEEGLYQLKDGSEPTRFMLTVEISTIYKKGDKVRKIHHVICAPSMKAAGHIRDRLGKIGNIRSDGRPILGLDSRNLLEIVLETDPHAYLIPAHIWTPWFAALGSMSGFDSIDECYGDLSPHIFAVETGLSSDPPMNWRLSQLDRFTLVSNSDAHSPPKLGREANVFQTEMTYFAIEEALRTRKGFHGTVEFFPEEGKYHLDGHRACQQRLTPEETLAYEGRCPDCGGRITVGVMHRVNKLADRPESYRPKAPAPFRSLIPLPEVLSEILATGPASKKVQGEYERILGALGSELHILQDAPLEDLNRHGHPLLAEGLTRMRQGQVRREAGYDGEYGRIKLFSPKELQSTASRSKR